MKIKRVSMVLLLLICSMVFSGMVYGEEVVVTGDDVKVLEEGGDEDSSQAHLATIAGLVGAALAFGLGALGAGVAIGRVGSAAMGAIAEKPSIAGQALIFVALAEGIVVFGFITALMILGKI